jgi:UDP-galactose transporter B1
VRSLRYVIFPVQVLAKSCKPIPVMIMGALMGKKYPLRKYINVSLITVGVALFMGGGDSKHGGDDADKMGPTMIIGVALLFVSLSFDGATGAYEDMIMSTAHVGPFELMYNIQLGKCILAGLGLIFTNEVNYFFVMCQQTGPVLVVLGLTGAIGQVFIFVTISKFGALTCSIMGLMRKITTLVTSIIIYGHELNFTQAGGLGLSIGAMIYNFLDKSSSKKGKKKDPTTGSAAGPAAVDVQRAAKQELSTLLKDGAANEVDEEGGLTDEGVSDNSTPSETRS